jgi:hypothetical protein
MNNVFESPPIMPETVSIGKQNPERHSQFFDCLPHGKDGGLENVDPIDHIVPDDTDSDTQGLVIDVVVEALTLFCAQLL